MGLPPRRIRCIEPPIFGGHRRRLLPSREVRGDEEEVPQIPSNRTEHRQPARTFVRHALSSAELAVSNAVRAIAAQTFYVLSPEFRP